MNSLSQYISEKLHLSKDNKNLVPKDIDAGEFIESFTDKEERNWIIRLIGFCIKHVDKKPDDHECYVVEYLNSYKNIDRFGWSDNKNHEYHKVGDVIEYSSGIGTTKYKIIYVVTKNTIIPNKYKQ